MGKSVWDYIAPIAGTALGSAVGMPWLGAAVGSGLNAGIKTGNPLSGLAAGAASGAGTFAGSQLLGPTLSGLGGGVNPASGAPTTGFLGNSLGKALGDTALSSADTFGGQTLGDMAGGAIGSKVAMGATESASPGIFSPSISTDQPAAPGFKPSQQGAMGLPGSLSSLNGLSPQQQATNIATRGVYGQGNGPDETSYFNNLINRQLVDPSGNVAGDLSGINPVEGSYLNQIGLGGYNNPTDLLQKLHGYAA